MPDTYAAILADAVQGEPYSLDDLRSRRRTRALSKWRHRIWMRLGTEFGMSSREIAEAVNREPSTIRHALTQVREAESRPKWQPKRGKGGLFLAQRFNAEGRVDPGGGYVSWYGPVPRPKAFELFKIRSLFDG